MRRATVTVLGIQHRVGISIHALLAESDYSGHDQLALLLDFYPRSPCGERPRAANCQHRSHQISIHALLAESDRLCTILYSCPGNFYPRSPCGERRHIYYVSAGQGNFYPRSPCGERPFARRWAAWCCLFLSTLSLRRATPIGSKARIGYRISIHALLAESDIQYRQRGKFLKRFLSTLSLRRATEMMFDTDVGIPFLSTLSLRRATWLRCWKLAARDISIHALLAESDRFRRWPISRNRNFYPRSPCGERRYEYYGAQQRQNFYPRSPCGERHQYEHCE